MKIYTDSKYIIRAIEKTSRIDLTEHEVDRDAVFATMSNSHILCYKYLAFEDGYSLVPAIDTSIIDVLAAQENDRIQNSIPTPVVPLDSNSEV